MVRSDEIKKEIKQSKKSRKKIIVLASVVIIAVFLFYLYFFIISPTFVTKPYLEKPTLQAGQNVEEGHVNWVINELGGYKLHAAPLGGDPLIELITEGKTFTVKIISNQVSSYLGKATDPDIRITAEREAFERILSADDIKTEINNLYNEGKITIELLKDETSLVLKGYKAIYDELQG